MKEKHYSFSPEDITVDILDNIIRKKVRVGKNQELAQSKRNSCSKNQVEKN